ncbi:uncharacterized protein TRIADDRAFT_24110 [Trichoplax adhaerens]|uniref:Transmembrane 9 superfamily member n=1 Tax=Trichoplax adhaerens TaxID=10228 RepID=B3RUA3_TRIAD|nr:hypothetical protein TRIADDRAFT_24110 [Trichoplax adhaerens]EDV25778.1 hypothetical protein TRIADDRAFT_24110 [Trichoplax adhaerens]|eukprot:XP_002111811.1 hypothetical protein TRIADDRAFT_24110 [Trichoplax adhaerens]
MVNCNITSPWIFRDNLVVNTSITYTYSVHFKRDNSTLWSSRWDYILKSHSHPTILWFSLINSTIVLVLLCACVALILLRTLRNKEIRCCRSQSLEKTQAESGWKLIHGDIFRPPGKTMLLSILSGTGIQLLITTTIILLLACFGALSPASRGELATCALFLYLFSSCFAGYTAARIYKAIGGLHWKTMTLMTFFLLPVVVVAIFFLLNIFVWAGQSSAAIPFGTFVAVMALWIGISMPMTFIGAFLGFKKKPIQNPVETNRIPRKIPPTKFIMKLWPGVLMGGLLPFSSFFIPFYFILSSIWMHQIFYASGFLFPMFCVFILTTAESTICLCYAHLSVEDYQWWWRSFLTGGGCCFYILVYSIYFVSIRSGLVGGTSIFLFIGYTTIIMLFVFILGGSIGFLTSYYFVRKIYSAVGVA